MILLRSVLVSFTLAALLFALNSKSTMYEMVQNAYKVTLVGAFVPLAAGIFWQRANNAGAIMSIVLGLVSWAAMEVFGGETIWPPQLVGLAFAILGMLVGSFAGKGPSHPDAVAHPAHHAPHPHEEHGSH